MYRFIKEDVLDGTYEDAPIFLREGEQVEVTKCRISENFNSGVAVFVVGEQDQEDWICASFLVKEFNKI